MISKILVRGLLRTYVDGNTAIVEWEVASKTLEMIE